MTTHLNAVPEILADSHIERFIQRLDAENGVRSRMHRLAHEEQLKRNRLHMLLRSICGDITSALTDWTVA